MMEIKKNARAQIAPVRFYLLCAAVLLCLTGQSLAANAAAEDDGEIIEKILPNGVENENGIKVDVTEVPVGAAWQGLFCKEKHCKLRPVKLRIRKDRDSPDDRLVSLTRTSRGKQGETLITLLAGLPPSKKSIPAYYYAPPERQRTNDPAGISIKTAKFGTYRILPRWKTAAPETTFYLEHGKQRQALETMSLAVLENGFGTENFLLWAGDLDADGKPDWVTSSAKTIRNETQGTERFWLSSKAGDGLYYSQTGVNETGHGKIAGLVASTYWKIIEQEEP